MTNEFLVYSPLTRKSVNDFTQKNTEEDERILLEGVASTTNKDLTGEIISPEALKSMAQQATGVNIHGDHNYGLNDVVGAVKEVIEEPDNFRVKFLVTKKHTPAVRDLLETGVNLGLSIGGFVHDYDHRTKTIKNIQLNEISLTPMPANMDTFGTVHEDSGLTKSNCLTGACYHIIKNLEVNKMTDNTQQSENKTEEKQTEEKQKESETLTRENVVDLFNELMASEKQGIVDSITKDVKSGLEDMVKSTVNDMLSESDEEDKPKADTETNIEESLKSITDTLSKQIDTKFEEIHKGLFKDLENNRQPESPVEKALHDNEDDELSVSSFTTKSIAEKLVNTDSRTQLINKIKQ